MVKTGFHSHQTQSRCDFTRTDFVALLEWSCKHSSLSSKIKINIRCLNMSWFHFSAKSKSRKTPHLEFACRATCLFGKRVFFCYLNFSVVKIENQRVQHFTREILYLQTLCVSLPLYTFAIIEKLTNKQTWCASASHVTLLIGIYQLGFAFHAGSVEVKGQIWNDSSALGAVSLSSALVLTQSL